MRALVDLLVNVGEHLPQHLFTGIAVDLTAQENIHAAVIFAPELMQLRQALV